MKKLLSLLSVLTISGTAVPTTIAASPYKTEEQETKFKSKKINRVKRNNNSNWIKEDGGGFFSGSKKYILNFSPDVFEELICLISKEKKSGNNPANFRSDFKLKFADKFLEYSYAPINRETLYEIAHYINNSWWIINNFWQNTNRKKIINIVFERNRKNMSDNGYLELKDIKTLEEENNKYLNKLLNDFNGDLSKTVIDLGIIEDKNDNFIYRKLKEKYPKLDTSSIVFVEKKDYSFLDKGFSTKIEFWYSSNLKYPVQTLNNNFIFITKKWLNEDLPKLIDNEDLIQNWKTNFVNWQNEINRQINEDLPKYGNDERGKALKRTWKGNNINELNNKLLSLNHILETIDSNFKLNELYSKVQNLSKDINELKSQINKLNQEIFKIQNSLNKDNNLENCSNIGGLISASTGWIPYIGTLVSTVSGTAAAICTIANA